MPKSDMHYRLLPCMKNLWAPLRPIVWTALLMWVLMTLSRVGLLLWHFEQVVEKHAVLPILFGGLRADMAWIALTLTLPACITMVLPRQRYWHAILRIWLVAQIMWVVFMEAATPSFMQEYGLRPNRLFLEYLIYPMEVGATLVKGHWLSSLLGLSAVVVSAMLAWRSPALRAAMRERAAAVYWRIPAAVLVLLAGAMAARSTLGHRPLNPAMLAFSDNATLNQLPLNSAYALAHAARDWRQESKEGAIAYATLPWEEVVDEIRRETGLPDAAFVSSTLPSLAVRAPVHTGKPRNLVIVLEESLGAQFVGHLGGRPLTPELDALGEQGWRFNRMYATGTRSVRGIEAVLTGFTPTPAQAVVKLSRSQQNFFTLAQLLRSQGYDTTFYYGGESHFDNMRSFFLGNGFSRIIDQKDFEAPAFTGSWGVSDEDVMRRAHREFLQLQQTGKPFFGLIFSSSNHDPFEFPDGRIALYEQPKATRNNAAKYADYAIGEFFRLAKNSPYWKDTLFLVVADHDSRVIGQSLVPVANFHIPAVLLGEGIPVRKDERIASQIDLPVTLLSLMGISGPTPMLGRDLNREPDGAPGRAMMQYDNNFAWMEGERVVILQPEKAPAGFTYDPASKRLAPAAADAAMTRRAQAISQWGTEAYRRELYRLPASE